MTSVTQRMPTLPGSIDSDPLNFRVIGHQYSCSSGIIPSKNRKSLALLVKGTVDNLQTLATPQTSPKFLSTKNLRKSSSQSTLNSEPRSPALATSPSKAYPSAKHSSSTKQATILEDEPNCKLHQTSSKAVRTTSDGRPFTRDFKDLFSTLITSLPLGVHRVRFQKVEHTFLAEEAIANLSSLTLKQSNRIPDPNHPTKWIVATTTTSFSMTSEVARRTCHRFVDARFIEAVEGKYYKEFPSRGVVYQLTPKGIQILKRFCDRNGINEKHLAPLLRKAQMEIVALERDAKTDKLVRDRATVDVTFRRMCEGNRSNLKITATQPDPECLPEYATGTAGIRMAKTRKIGQRDISFTFTGRSAADWLLDCCTIIDKAEAHELCELFIKHHLIKQVVVDVDYPSGTNSTTFQPSKYAIYAVTSKGQIVNGWMPDTDTSTHESSMDTRRDHATNHSSTSLGRLRMVMDDAALRMLFRERLRASLCEENLNFYLDNQEFLTSYHNATSFGRTADLESVREHFAMAYRLYNAFLAAGSPSELNIDHCLRQKLDRRMTTMNSSEETVHEALQQIVELMEQALESIAKLMATDSVPKFFRDPKYQSVIREHQIDLSLAQKAVVVGPD